MLIDVKPRHKDERVRNKSAFTYDGHGATAVRLATVRHYLKHFAVEIERGYGGDLSKKTAKTIAALRDLNSSLNEQLEHEYGPPQGPDTVYFPDDEGGVTNAPIFERDLREKYLGCERSNDIDYDGRNHFADYESFMKARNVDLNRPIGEQFSTDEHIAVGGRLRAIANYAGTLIVKLSHSYSLNSHMIQRALRFYDGCGGGALGDLICALDSRYFRDCPSVPANVRYIYYDNGTEAAKKYFNLSTAEMDPGCPGVPR
jgi:hypothetical protein